MEVNQKKPGIVSWQSWKKVMKIWADYETLCKPLDCLYVRRKGGVIQYRRNPLDPCKFDHGQEVAWTPSEKVFSVSVSTQDRAMIWKGTYCSGITGDIAHRQPGTSTEYIAGLSTWEQELINEVEIL
eukprot:5405476-Ditylum_brightwellii.AAC.1